ncbi:MAG TPA: orotidine-5'-phosphate decarboxylase [Candidatus Binatia bacterium]|nr:orotidine-5'-phosphate decarboxylase [Candidatus Binatia bacterium]
MSSQLVVALDVSELERARSLVELLRPLGVTFKIGYEALYAFGDALIAQLSGEQTPYVLDLKLHDIPRTVEAAVNAVVRPGLKIVTVHALGGNEMMRAAVEAASESATALGIPEPAIFAVTLLTSIGAEDLNELGLMGGPGENVIRLAALSRDAGCGGIVCSPHEAADIKSFFGTGFATFCPGIRPTGSAHGDQKRVATPAEALQAGADYIVVGRPITEADDPVAAARAILEEMSTVGAAR